MSLFTTETPRKIQEKVRRRTRLSVHNRLQYKHETHNSKPLGKGVAIPNGL